MKKNLNESIFQNISKNLIKSNNIDNIFKIGFNIKNSNDKLYNFVKNKIDIPINSINIFKVDSDGNCYYRCLSQFLYDTPEKHPEFRNIIYQFCNSNKDVITEFQPQVEIRII